ncbi:MAG: hypothetical protein K6B70_00245 [Clostridia bacterium]|nr:hypothetical protein [Clostridia bacterium]
MSDSNDLKEILEKIEILTNKVEEIEKKQKIIEDKINQVYNSVSGIEKDIYEDDFEVEIICPYCNTEFVADVEAKSEIKCPECQNVIELDWNSGDEQQCCSGHCSGCGSKCGGSFIEEFGEDINIIDDEEDM